MRPLLKPKLVNGRTGDPALYIETLFEKRAILFDLGDITPLSPRNIQRLEHVFVSHAHIDHFVGFDRLLRLMVGRDKEIALYGPMDFVDHVHHKLQAYRWNLANRYMSDLTFVVTEVASGSRTRLLPSLSARVDSSMASSAASRLSGSQLRSWNIVRHAWDSLSRNPRASTFGRTASRNWSYRLAPGCANSSRR